jgi:hypothetical protein
MRSLVSILAKILIVNRDFFGGSVVFRVWTRGLFSIYKLGSKKFLGVMERELGPKLKT